MGMGIKSVIHNAIKHIWQNNLKEDYEKGWLWREDSLKNAFYFHLRNTLGKEFFETNGLRIVTELNLDDYYYRVDLAVVRVDDEYELQQNEPIALVEFKFKNSSCAPEIITSDIKKFQQLCKDPAFASAYFYLAILHEEHYSRNDASWLDGRQWRWARSYLTELSGFFDLETDELVMTVVSGDEDQYIRGPLEK